MKFETPGMHWHAQEPVLSVDFHRTAEILRLASGGADSEIGIWKVCNGADDKLTVQLLSRLLRHSSAVNVVRFSPSGEFLASAGDDQLVILWSRDTTFTGGKIFYHDSDLEVKEQWRVVKVLRGHLGDIYDLSWSKDSRFIISGSVDNCAIIWAVQSDHPLQCRLQEAHHYIQGVCWDPLGDFAITHSSDRAMRVYKSSGKYRCMHSVKTFSAQQPTTGSAKADVKQFRMFVDETMTTFFRRLVFSPDGAILVAPAGCFEVDSKTVNTTYIFARNNFTRPIAHLPGISKPSIAVSFCPLLFKLREKPLLNVPKCSTIRLPYRMVFAIATVNSVLLYDTQHFQPIAFVDNIHWHTLTDLSWSRDGKMLAVSSMDNFCTILKFSEGELGEEYVQDKPEKVFPGVSSPPVRTPTIVSLPSHPKSPLTTQANGSTPKRPVAASSTIEAPVLSPKMPLVSSPANEAVTPVALRPTPSLPTPASPVKSENALAKDTVDNPVTIDITPNPVAQTHLVVRPKYNDENVGVEPMDVDCTAPKLDTGPVKLAGNQLGKPRRIALTTLTKF